jgi:branched-chain amino acid transport system substrate-binding protein
MILIRLLIVFAVSLLLIGCEPEKAPLKSGKVVKIGVIAPLSGPEEEWGENGLLGVKTALELKPYLLNGDKPELILEDDKNNPELTVKALHKLATQDQVSAILIFSDSAAVLAVVEEAEEYKIPILALIATHPEISSGDWISQFSFDDKLQGTIAALFVIDELLVEHVGVVVNEDDPHSIFLVDEFSSRFKEAGGVIERATINNGTTDFSKIVRGFREKGLDFLYLPLDADHVVLIEEVVSKMGWNPQVMVSDGLLGRIQLQYGEKLDIIDGMLSPEVYSTDMPRSEYGRKVTSIFKEKFNQFGTTFSGLGCEGTSVLLAAIDRCEDTSDRPCINRMLRSTNGFVGLYGKLYIGENGKTERPVFIIMIKDTDLKLVVKIY